MRTAGLIGLVFLVACSGGSSSSAPSTSGGGGGPCPDLSGAWKVTQHCDASLVGSSATVTEGDCKLTFGAPFNQFTGTVAADGSLSLSGPQTCSGTTSSSSISMTCTPGTCAVTLSR